MTYATETDNNTRAAVAATERRKFPRYQVSVPAEVRLVGSSAIYHVSTTDVSLGGCYVGMMFTLDIGTEMELALEFGESQVFCHGRVVTCDPQVGNGIAFVDMLEADREELREFLEKVRPATAQYQPAPCFEFVGNSEQSFLSWPGVEPVPVLASHET